MRRQFALLAALGLSMLLGTGCCQDTAVSSPDGGLTLLFEANAALGSLRASSQQYAQHPKLQQIAAILERYPGVMLGAELKRR